MKILEAIKRAGPFFSFVVGLGISVLLFHRDYSVVRELGVSLDQVVSTVSRSDGKCYRYRVEDANCSSST